VGEAPRPAMTHIAVQEAFGGSPVDWLEHASGEGEGVRCCALRPTAPPSSYPVRVQCTAWRFPVAHLTLFALRPINQMKRIVIMTHSIPPLVLPKRFEALQRQAQSQDADISRIVYRVDDAATLSVRNLIPSETLESFGLTEDKVQSQLALSDTMGEFYSRLEAESQKINLKVPGHS
jgi:hypothetical protein